MKGWQIYPKEFSVSEKPLLLFFILLAEIFSKNTKVNNLQSMINIKKNGVLRTRLVFFTAVQTVL